MTDITSRVRIDRTDILSDNHYILKTVHFAWQRSMGNGRRRGARCTIATTDARSCCSTATNEPVILTRQFRMAAFQDGYRDLMIEVAAGLLDDADPMTRILHEAEEETGFIPSNIRKIGECYVSPGAVKQKLHLFVGEYDPAKRAGKGGGLEDEGEDIEVLEVSFEEAVAMMADGRICDAKTIMLLQHAQLHVFA